MSRHYLWAGLAVASAIAVLPSPTTAESQIVEAELHLDGSDQSLAITGFAWDTGGTLALKSMQQSAV